MEVHCFVLSRFFCLLLDFSEELARMNLTDLPNSLYKGNNEAETGGSRERRPSSAAAATDFNANRRNRSSSSGPFLAKPHATDSVHNDHTTADEVRSRDLNSRAMKGDAPDARAAGVAPVRLWSALLNPSDKFITPVREKTPVTVLASQKSARDNKKSRSVTPSRENQTSSKVVVDSSKSLEDSHSVATKSRKLTPSRDRAEDKKVRPLQNSAGAASNERSQIPQPSARNTPSVDKKSPARSRENSSGGKSVPKLADNHTGVNRESRATSQGRPGKTDVNSLPAGKTNPHPKQVNSTQSETSKRKQRKKKTAASSAADQPEVQMPAAPAPHFDNFAEFPTLAGASVRIDHGWGSGRHQHSSPASTAPFVVSS